MIVGRPISLIVALCSLAPAATAQQPARPSEIAIEKFAQLPLMRQARLSPAGTHIAYIRPHKGQGHLIIQPLGGATTPTVVPPAQSMAIDWLHWANPDRVVFSVSATSRRGITETLETRLYAIDKDGKHLEHIVRPSRQAVSGSNLPRELAPPQIQDDVIHWLPDEPNHILLSVDGNHDGADEVRRVDIRDGKFDEVRNDYDGIQNWLTDQTGKLHLGWGYRMSTVRVLTKAADGQWRNAKKSDWYDAGYFPQGFTESPDVAYMRGPDENGYMVIKTMNVDTGEFLETVFEKPGLDAGGLVPDPLTRQPVGVTYVEHFEQTVYFDDELASLQHAIDRVKPDTVNDIISMSADRRKVLIHSFSDVDPGTFAYLDRDKNEMSFIAEAMPGLLPELMSPVEAVSYEARDGVRIPAYLTVPRGLPREGLRMVVMPHGGPASRDDKTFWFLSQFLASRGYAVFQPNFRGSSGYGKGFEHAGRKEWGGKMQEDVTDGTTWLIAEGIAAPDRICIVGWSYGGYSAAMGAVQTPELYQCAGSINGVLDLPGLIADDKKYIGGSSWTRHMGLEDESARSVSPYHQAERIQVPVLIAQAKDDARVHDDQAKRMVKRLKRLKKPVEYVKVEFGGHSMNNETARLQILQSLERFLGENI